MSRKTGVLLGILLFFGALCAASGALAGVPKVVVAENFGATW